MSGALWFVTVLIAVVGPLSVLARRRMIRERRRAELRALLDKMRRDVEAVAIVIGTALLPAVKAMLPAVQKAALAFAEFGRAFTAPPSPQDQP